MRAFLSLTQHYVRPVRCFLWNGFCGNLIRRANRNTLIAALILLGLIAAVAYYNAKYLASFFSGAHVVAPETLSTSDPAKLTDTFIKMEVGEAIPTGVQHITKDDSHPSGSVDSTYLATIAGGKTVIVRAEQEPGTGPVTFEGRFVPMESDLQASIQNALGQGSNLPPVLLVYLDTVDYKSDGYTMLVIGIPLLLLALWMLWRIQQFSADFSRHPFARRLSNYGQLEMLVHEVDSEVAGIHTEYGKTSSGIVVTQHWFIGRNNWGGTPLRLDRVAWAYRHITKRKILYFITISKWYSVVAYDSFGSKIQIRLKEQQVADALQDLAVRTPQAIFGYDKRLWKLWKSLGKDKSRFATDARGIVSTQDVLKDKISTMWNA